MATPLDALSPGDRLGDLVIERPLGKGGMGVVYAARDPSGRAVAVKVPSRAVAVEPDLRARFDREARAAAGVRHPGVVTVHAVHAAAGWPYLVLELVTGGSLRDRLREGPMPWREAAALALGVTRGLAAVHAAGLVHRDLKPENVLLDDEGRPKLADFGLVRDARCELDLTRTGEVLGTPAYMAPEQADRARDVTAPSDLYALGCVLHELLTGRPPFAGSGFEVLARHQSAPPPSPRRDAPDVPEPLDALVVSLLAKDPAARPGALDVIAVLEGLIARPVAARSGRSTAAGVGVALLLVVAVVCAAGAALAPDPAASSPVTPARPTSTPIAPAPPAPAQPGVASSSPLRLEQARAVEPDPRLRHPDGISAVAAREGALFSGDESARIRRWDPRTGEQRWSAAAGGGAVIALEAVVGGTRLLSVTRAGWIEEWDPQTGARRSSRRLALPAPPPGREEARKDELGAAAAPDDRGLIVVASTHAPAAVSLVPLDPRDAPRALGTVGHRPALAVDPAGRRVVAGDRDGVLVVWDLDAEPPRRRDLRLAHEPRGTEGGVWDLDISSDGRALISGGGDRRVRLWTIPDAGLPVGRELGGPFEERLLAVALSPDGRWAAGADARGAVRVWDLANDRAQIELMTQHGEVRALAFDHASPPVLWSGGEAQLLGSWYTGTLARTALDAELAHRVCALATDGGRVAVGRSDGRVEVRDLATLSAGEAIPVATRPVLSLALSGARVLAGCERGIALLDLAAGVSPGWLARPSSTIALALPQGELPLFAGRGLWLWDGGLQPYQIFNKHPTRAAASRDGSIVALLADEAATIARVRFGVPPPPVEHASLAASQAMLQDVAISADGAVAATIGRGGLALWDTRTLGRRRLLPGGQWVALSPRGTAAVWRDGAALLAIDGRPGEPARRVLEGGDAPSAAVFVAEDEVVVGTHAGGLLHLRLAR